MKKKCALIATLAGFGLALHAENAVTMHAPFEFVAAGKAMPAGDYRMTVVQPGVLLIAGMDNPGRVLALVNVSPVSAAASLGGAAVTFDRSGEAPMLASVSSSSGTWSLPGITPSRLAVSLLPKGTPKK